MIDEHKFGSFVVDGRNYLGDIKILGTRVKHWQDREKHIVNQTDIKELLEINPEFIIVGTGNSGYLKVSQDAKDLIYARRIKLVIDVNQNAVTRYNELKKEGKSIAAIFHATC